MAWYGAFIGYAVKAPVITLMKKLTDSINIIIQWFAAIVKRHKTPVLPN